MCGRSVAFQRGAKEVSRARTPALCIQIDPQSASLARVLIIHRLVTVRPQWVRLIIYAATSAEKCTRFLLFAAHPLSLRLVCKHAHDSNSTQFEPGEKEAEEVMCWLASKPGLRVPLVAFELIIDTRAASSGVEGCVDMELSVSRAKSLWRKS